MQRSVWLDRPELRVRFSIPEQNEHSVRAALADLEATADTGRLLATLSSHLSPESLREVAIQVGHEAPLDATLPGLARAARSGEARIVLSFAGQAQAWIDELSALWADPLAQVVINACADAAQDELEMRHALTGLYPFGVDIRAWLRDPAARPDAVALAAGPLSQPFIFVTQAARLATLTRVGLAPHDIGEWAIAATGHSQGVQTALLAAEALQPAAFAARAATLTRLLMRQGVHMQSAWGRTRNSTAMLAIAGPDRAEIVALLGDLEAEISLENGPTRHVLSGEPQAIERFVRRVEAAHAKAEARAAAGQGQRPVPPTIERLAVSAPYHSKFMQPAVDALRADVNALGLRPDPARFAVPVLHYTTGAPWAAGDDIAWALCRGAVRWPTTMQTVADMGATHLIDVGPGAGCAALAGLNLAGAGVAVIAAATAKGLAALDSLDAPARPTPWAEYAPQVTAAAADETPRLANRWTRRIGRPPMILPGMTPTTVDSAIVSAAANAGFLAELAGGGQPTEAILRRRADALRAELSPGEGYVFNALYLDPYLWGLHLGGRKLVQQLKSEGHPIDGVTVSAGLPPVDEAVALLAEWRALGMHHNSLKAGNDAQIKQVLSIADADGGLVILQLEGGRAGGHHSFEDLETLLLRWYARIRRRDNVLLTVGGGIATPERVSALLHGTWSTTHGRRRMPVDAVFIGTACMAAAEATTSPAVKAALVAAPGDAEMSRRGQTSGGVISGRSGLGADIHYLDNHAAQVARMLDEVAGDTAAALARKDEIVAALAQTAKPYFGDLATMSYHAFLERLAQLMALGSAGPFEDGVWLDPSHRARFGDALRRALQRCGCACALPDDADLNDPVRNLDAYTVGCPALCSTPVLPEDRAWFVEQLCARPGKPVPFVPVIDANVHRWYTKDSLWQAHDPRYAADAVLVLPGPAGVAGIAQADEPIAALLDRFLDATRADCGAPIAVDDVAPELPAAVNAAITAGARLDAHTLTLTHAAPTGTAHGVELPLHRSRRGLALPTDMPARMRAFYQRVMPATVTLDAARVAAYRRATSDDGAKLPIQLIFAAALPALMARVLSDALGNDPLALLHVSSTLLRVGDLRIGAAQVQVQPASVTDGPTGRTLQFSAAIFQDGQPVAEQTQVFLVRRFDGPCPAPQALAVVPAPAGVALTRPRRILDAAPLRAPADMAAFAQASGDLNPIHRDAALAALAGLDAPIVHGQWTAAAAGALLGGRLDHVHARFLAPVPLGARLTVTADVVARRAGAEIIEMTVHHGDAAVMQQTVERAAVATAVVFPGQGCQQRGMGMQTYARSPAAQAVWDRADAHCRATHGWSILDVVRDNPRQMRARDVDGVMQVVQHPKGVLHLTQFTQVALCTLAVAGVAELEERGVLPADPFIAGHSVGEYSALAALTGVLPLEGVIDVVYARGQTMQHFVPRDAQGRSPYGMSVIRPHKAGLGADDVEVLVAEAARALGKPAYVVNYNIRGRQYAIAGHVDALAALRARLPADAWVDLAGIDVPFHSPIIASGVDAFRAVLDGCFPQDIDVQSLVGRYIPNLVAVPFALTPEFVALAEVAIDRELAEIKADPVTHGRALLIELLAWQFASPVRWIQTQDVLIDAVERVIEVGPAEAAVLGNMLHSTLRRDDRQLDVLHSGADLDAVIGNGAEVIDEPEIDDTPVTVAPVAVAAAPVGDSAAPALDDQAFTVDDALRALIAISIEQPLDAVAGTDTLDELLGGNSARRNAVLADLGKEFGVGAVDGAHELPMPGLVAAVAQAAGGRYRHPGAWLRAAQDASLKALGLTRKAAEARLSDHFGLPPGRRAGVLTVLAADGGDLDGAVAAYGRRVGETITPRAAAQSSAAVATGEAAGIAQARWKALAKAALQAGGLDPSLIDRPVTDAPTQPTEDAEPGFNPERLVSFTAATVWARADALRAFHALNRGERVDLTPLARAASPALIDILETLSANAKPAVAERLRAAKVAALAALDATPTWANEVALITGAGPESIAEAVAARLLEGGATVVVSTSRMTPDRVARFKGLYRDHAARGAQLHVVPLDQGDLTAVDAFVDWAFDAPLFNTGHPTLCLPFGAMPAEGDPTTYDARTIRSLQVNLLGVERLVARLGQRAMVDGDPVHVVLPLSPNHGQMGRDGLYAEAKAALEALLPRRVSESRWWGAGVTICGARIGWVRGTGLMAGLDRVYEAVEAELGITTYAPHEMADMLLAQCAAEARSQGGWIADLAGGMGPDADLRPIIEAALSTARTAQAEADPHGPLPAMLFTFPPLPEPINGAAPDLASMVAVVGYGEVGPFGNARVRWSMEKTGGLDAGAALELAWLCGCVRFEKGRFVDAESGEPVDTADLDALYGLSDRVGIRDFEAFDPAEQVLFDEIILEQDLRFSVPDAATAQAFCVLDQTHTTAFEGADGWQVVRKAGGRIRVPRALPIDRDIAGQLPVGWDATRLGFDASQVSNIDPVALFNLLATAAAFRSAGLTPEELWTHVDPSRIGCSVGSGMGGMRAIQRLYAESKLAERRQTDALQESLINVTAAYPAMTYYGGAGPMVHPVAACATAAVSVEVGVDLIRAGKAEIIVAGGADDLCPEGARGFADMQATIDAETRAIRGLKPSQASRPCDARRGGFVESQGGGAMILARADVAVRMGLPIHGLVAGAWSFGDGLQRSVPAPGPGLSAVAGPLKAALAALDLTPDDVGAVSIHGTSTQANDINETALHAGIAREMGRTEGNPLPVIAQKALTGHSKGGAAAWQMNGVLQAMADGVIPGMPNLDEPDPDLGDLTPLVYPDRPIEVGAGALKAALVTSLGFGHVGACVCLVHPDVVLARLPAAERDAYAAARDARWRARLEAEHAVLLDQSPAVTLRQPAETAC